MAESMTLPFNAPQEPRGTMRPTVYAAVLELRRHGWIVYRAGSMHKVWPHMNSSPKLVRSEDLLRFAKGLKP